MEEAGSYCLLQNTLKTICSFPNSSSSSSKWVYAVFWKIVPRNFPPPRWEFGGTALDCSKGNKRNWILVWEDGYCDFNECEQVRNGITKGRFGPNSFFKMSHEVYSYGEGLVGKVAAENSHKWVNSDTQNGCESSYVGPWNASIDHQPRTWEIQLNSGIQTIAVIAVREGLVQMGSFQKIVEDLNLVVTIQRKFNYLHSIPGALFPIQRPNHHHHPYNIPKPNFQMISSNNEITLSPYNFNQLGARFNGIMHHHDERERSRLFSNITLNLGRDNNGITPIWSCSSSSYDHNQVHEANKINGSGIKVKVEEKRFYVDDDEDQKGKTGWY